jgi:D-serine deaminase-like pyridoxal phosphate-dependent protein
MNAAPDPRLARFAGLIGQGVAAIDTPALVVDLDAMERNLHRMADFCSARGLRLRPHAKMHKCAELAKLQMAHGAVGVCVQKIDEALALAAQGVDDIYVSNEVVDPSKLARLAQAVLANGNGGTRFAIAVDSALGVQHLAEALANAGATHAQAIDVFVEIDIGHGRCGVAPGEPALALARAVASHRTLRFTGLQAYHGSAQHQRPVTERRDAIARAAQSVAHTRSLIEAAGIAVPLVTGAGTGTFVHEAASGLWGELQAGSYLFMDADYAANTPDDGAPAFEHALFVKAQVMSRGDDRAVIDAGHKSHAIDSGMPQVWWPDGLVFANGGDEHGVLRGAHLPELGEAVWLVPGHCDPTVNLHDAMVGVRGGLTTGHVERLLRVDARGGVG